MNNPHPVIHFEMPYENRERAADFYSKAFGWKPQMLGAEMGNYVVMQTTETDDKGMVKTPGNINGGMYEKTEDTTCNHPSVVISTDDLKASMKSITDAGGKLLGELLSDPDPKKAERAMKAMLTMTKLDIATLEAAAR